MQRTPKKKIPFTGRASAVNPHVAPLVAQDNVTNVRPGQLTGRGGMRAVTFASAQGSASAYQVLGMFAFEGKLAPWVIYLDSSGAVQAGRSPA